jgi:hypothetical protein
MQTDRSDRSLGELFGDLAREMGVLIRQEMELAKTEMTGKVSRLGGGIGMLAAGGLVAYAGFLAILAGIIVGLATLGVPWWVSALLVGLIVVGIGYFLIQKGRDALRQADLTPRETLDTLRDDTRWAKEQVS